MTPRLLIVLCCLLTTPGCDQSATKVAPAVDLAPYRCPPLRSADRATFGKPPARAPGGALTEAGMKRWVDGLEQQVEARNRAGRRIMRVYDACRGQQAAPAT